jgi:hypothetical protein
MILEAVALFIAFELELSGYRLPILPVLSIKIRFMDIPKELATGIGRAVRFDRNSSFTDLVLPCFLSSALQALIKELVRIPEVNQMSDHERRRTLIIHTNKMKIS